MAIKLTIYRTSSDSPIIQALAEAARRGKQVAVLVEITARFDEEPNIAWGRLLEREGVHVSYGVEKLKTHVKLAMVVREEADGVRRYVHVGTGNYHSGTARLYEDVGILSCDPDLSADVAGVFNELTSSTPHNDYRLLLVAPHTMRKRFVELIRREATHAAEGRSSGIRAKMNQLQDPEIIRELYAAGMAGVPITLDVRGLCCLRPGVEGLSDNIRVFSVLGRFLEHGRIYGFENGGIAGVLHRLGGLDEAEPRPPDGDHRTGAGSLAGRRGGGNPDDRRERQLHRVGSSVEREVYSPPPGKERRAATLAAGVHEYRPVGPRRIRNSEFGILHIATPALQPTRKRFDRAMKGRRPPEVPFLTMTSVALLGQRRSARRDRSIAC